VSGVERAAAIAAPIPREAPVRRICVVMPLP